jgi:hypothetical protein
VQEGSRKAVAAAFLANLGIAIAEFVGFAPEPDLYRSNATVDS